MLKNEQFHKPVIAIHGGAGTILRTSLTPSMEEDYRRGLEESLEAGSSILEKGGTALDAVEAAVIVLEDNPLFNAGRGSVFTHEGVNEMDASIMCGKTLSAGAVACVHCVKNPVTLARAVKDKSEHVILTGSGAESFAREMNLKFEDADYFFVQFRYDQLMRIKNSGKTELDHAPDKKFGTVGAVALDKDGNLAAATSTGGMTNKMYGRVGDAPIIGAGTYANNATCAVSCTGHGEFFIRGVVAYDVSCLMEYKGLTLKEACELVIHDKLVKLGGEGGLVAVDKFGNVELSFNSPGMYRGRKHMGEKCSTGIFR